MASQDDDHHSSNGNPRPAVPAQLLAKKAAPRSSDQVRRNRMNMEKMIMKNVAASRNSTKNRAQQILEALKKKRQQQEDTSGAKADETERSAKRQKTSPPHGDAAARTAVAAGILSPARRAAGPSFTSPARRHNHPLNLKSPTLQQASPSRTRSVNPLHLSSPARPPRSSVLASPARPKRSNTASPLRRSESAYYILTGLGVGNLNLWRFVEPERYDQEPIWEHLQNFVAGGNTAMMAAFLPSSASPGVLAIAAVCRDKNLRVWPMEYTKTSSGDEGNDDSAEAEDTSFLGGVHTVNSHFNIQNTTDIVAIHGQYAYGISLMGEAYRICFPDSTNLNSSCERLPRQVFELESLAVVASLPDIGSSDAAHLRIIGKNASENTLFKAPMKVYTPKIKSKDNKVKSEAMMTVVTNPSDEDSDEEGGYINVDPTETFAARWMVPSRGQDCWVCGVRNASHWVGPPESKVKEPSRAQLEAQQKEKMRSQRRQDRLAKRAKDAAAQRNNTSDPETPVAAKPKTTPRSSAKKAVKSQPNVQTSATTANVSAEKRPLADLTRRLSQNSGAGDDDDEDYTGSDDNTPSIASLLSELEHFKKRNAEIKTEWQRRLLGERQLRRKWKQREEEFLDQLNDSLTKLDAAEVEVDRLRVLLRDAEKRFAFEKARVEQENSVKSRYEQLCEQMNDKMALVADQKRLLEQTTRSLLKEVDRNVHALKNAVILEKTECVVCKDQQAVTAVVPCGHLCFCEQDAETYRRNCTAQYPTCPFANRKSSPYCEFILETLDNSSID
ncbi:Eukaryotic translation initiation factor 3 subunit F-1 [Phytophthora nicotianae]|uniref:Eukaryotic translation initiation factor 3 subunit F-1 n=1 Tax=Phytophthora nicotianae TaxID=4792 RepID=A0A0W8DEI2_PHYNI|nr:Eukaryotic translation initiation factor 3 subunit F-1 [Phytophthora nicotianae]